MRHKRLLFVLRCRENYWGPSSYGHHSSGLANSVRFIVDMLNNHGITAFLEEVNDNNDIDRVVTQHRPTHVIIEAFWVVPEKFDVLKPLHPTVRWIVRNHSEMPFLANEGIAFGWSLDYMRRGVEVMSNAGRAQHDLAVVAVANGLPESLSTYGPNVYPDPDHGDMRPRMPHEPFDVGCFGAIRPLKNHISQAIGALLFADAQGVRLRFHINGTRIEGNGDPILKNLRSIFADAPRAELVEHSWLSHDAFLGLVASMDIVTQVSFTETFNIVAADAAAESVPVVVSREVPWIGRYAWADPNDTRDIADTMADIYASPLLPRLHQQRRDLMAYVRESTDVWLGRFG